VTRTSYLETRLVPGPRTAVKVVRVKHGGDWYVGRNYDEFAHLAATFGETVPLKVESGEPADPSGLAAAGAALAHLTGRQGVSLSEAEGDALKAWLAAGGLLFAEAAMGDARFDADFRKLAARVGLELKALEAGDPIISGAFDGATGYNAANVNYKFHVRAERIGRPLPLMYGLYLGGREVGVYSPLDISYAQTGLDAWGCRGYEAEDAQALLTNILLSATCGKP
jgi:hypothetical protein